MVKIDRDLFVDLSTHRGMTVAILGSGSAVPDPTRGNPSAAVVVDGDILLFDCGERTTVNLTRVGINPNEVDSLFLTHLHWDHIADLNYLLMTTWNCGKNDSMRIYGPKGTEKTVDGFLEAHHLDVKFVEKYRKNLPLEREGIISASPPYSIETIESGTIFEAEKYKVHAIEVEHLTPLDECFVGTCWAFRVDSPYGSMAFSGDTSAPNDNMVKLASGVDLLIHEATFPQEVIDKQVLAGHSSPIGAGRVAAEADVGKLVLTHLGPYDAPQAAKAMGSTYYDDRSREIWSEYIRSAAREFDGPIVIPDDGMCFAVGEEN